MSQLQESRIDATPSTHLLRALCNQKIGWVNALAELIDNAFNAGASRVVIKTGGRSVIVEDDGRGMLDVTSAVRLGDHRVDIDAGNGMYGIGMKDAWLYAGDSIEVRSIRAGLQSSIRTSVFEMEASGDWSVSPPTQSACEEDACGTSIKLGLRHGRKLPSQENMQKLAWAFSPAIASGKQILWERGKKRIVLSPVSLPPFIDVVDDSFEVNGKSVTIHIGIIKDGHSMANGPLWYIHKHRIVTKSYLGIHRYNSERVGGTVTLGKGWALTKNKDDFDDNKEELGEAIENRCRMLLAKAEKLSTSLASESIKTAIESIINQGIAELKRERRTSGDTSGTVLPKFSGRKRRKAAKVSDQRGSVELAESNKKQKKAGELRLNWRALDSTKVGEFDPHSDTITLNIENSFVSHVRNAKSEIGQVVLAMAVFTDHQCMHKDGSKCLFEVQDFSQTLGHLLKTMVPRDKEVKSA